MLLSHSPVRRPLRALTLVVLVLAATARPARAQIYTWVDANGSMVLSNVPQGTNLGIPAYDVPAATRLRTTRAVEPTRSRSYDDLIETHASRNGVRSDLVRAVIQVESAFNARAVSNKGAMGLMQLMPATARQFGVRNAFDPAENVRGGVAYLRQLLDKYSGNERLALAAYNAGPGNVDKFGQTVPPFQETRDYVTRIRNIAGTRITPPASPDGSPASVAASTRIFRVVEVIDGREVVRYTDQAPQSR
ncbi:MAG: lytic transglycosylase domain-containing protein [Vicinamibacterales bacterium]